jgi:hypothetical protein
MLIGAILLGVVAYLLIFSPPPRALVRRAVVRKRTPSTQF